MEYERYTKKELAAIIREMKEKLKEVKHVEEQVTAQAEDMPFEALGVQRNEKGHYSLVKVVYDPEKNAAAFKEVVNLETHDFAIASYKAKEYLVEKILRKASGSKYV